MNKPGILFWLRMYEQARAKDLALGEKAMDSYRLRKSTLPEVEPTLAVGDPLTEDLLNELYYLRYVTNPKRMAEVQRGEL